MPAIARCSPSAKSQGSRRTTSSCSRPVPLCSISPKSGLPALEDWLRGRDYLEDRFTAGDLLMTTVPRILRQPLNLGRSVSDAPRFTDA